MLAPGDVAQPRRDHAAGERLGETQREALLFQQVEHDRLHVVVVHTEDDVADDGPHAHFFDGEDLVDGGLGFGLGGDAYLDAFHAARQEHDRAAAVALEPFELFVQFLRETRLAVTPGAQGARLDDAFDARARRSRSGSTVAPTISSIS